MIRGCASDWRTAVDTDLTHKGAGGHLLWPVFIATSKQIQYMRAIRVGAFLHLTDKWKRKGRKRHSFLSLLLSHAHPFISALAQLCLYGDCLPTRAASEGAGGVIQSRISPSHPASCYSYHAVTPRGCLREYQLSEGDFLLSFQPLPPLHLHFCADISSSPLHPLHLLILCFSFGSYSTYSPVDSVPISAVSSLRALLR